MTIKPGDLVRSMGVTAFYHEDTSLVQLTNTAYEPGTLEVGVYFVAPASGTVRLTIGGGVRDNGASALDRVFLAPQLFLGSSTGTEVLAPSVSLRGYGSVAEDTEFQYGCRVSLITGLTPGELYYIRTMHATSAGTDPDTADIAARDIIVIPMP
ncbi:hypothetical protein Ssi03_56810 [Sphaerisporangium siamense]|uniref:Uncharacterized protein n=1 Tax=Sphaerisporangium siamense TaxID=795645 RepID=A0A7W7D541_9ACTN|nr:hypothetical protein [Sphaerisporangium siamense]MBB4700276.1 hypothetical protein [Sphaerisporangium siamense]GII87691.1 hypothetical protein Ssi03_56810 [Sphaerisporangium siamense]